MSTIAAAITLASAVAWPFGAVCFRGDGHPLTDACFDAQFIVAEIVECPAGGPRPGDPANPDRIAHAWVTLREVRPDGTRVTVAAAQTLARVYTDTIPPQLTYIVGNDLLFADNAESCQCWSRLPTAPNDRRRCGG